MVNYQLTPSLLIKDSKLYKEYVTYKKNNILTLSAIVFATKIAINIMMMFDLKKDFFMWEPN